MIKIGQYEFQDSCPSDCKGLSIGHYPLNDFCTRCPIFNCQIIDKDGFRLLEPENFRLDWAAEWHKFFQTGEMPILCLEHPEDSNGQV